VVIRRLRKAFRHGSSSVETDGAIEDAIVGAVVDDEEPIHIAYLETQRALGRHVPMRAFLRVVDDLLERDVIALWSTDRGDRTELVAVPPTLGHMLEMENDASLSTYRFTLTLKTTSR
jgi:hypothetical protein